MSGLQSENDTLATKQYLAAFEARLSREIGGLGSDILKWMFIFWISQMAVTYGLILLFLKK